jgi:hypothetical protein
MPIRPYPPRLPGRPLRVRVFERVEEEFEREAADAADARAQCEAERANYDEDGDGDCWKGCGVSGRWLEGEEGGRGPRT